MLRDVGNIPQHDEADGPKQGAARVLAGVSAAPVDPNMGNAPWN
jgi:hypothetical protein